MNRRAFISWLGGGIAATVALSKAQVLAAEDLYRVASKFDPKTSLYLPGEQEIILPPERKLTIVTPEIVSAACYRYCTSEGSFWYDANMNLVNVLGRKGEPQSFLEVNVPSRHAVERGINRAKYAEAWSRDEQRFIRGGHVQLSSWESFDVFESLLPADMNRVVAKMLLEAR